MLGKWRSKTSDLVAVVEWVTDDAVWYTIPQYNRPQNCRIDIFMDSMDKMQEAANV